jgi:N-acetylglucosamine kinase-like BadF-type ATPase
MAIKLIADSGATKCEWCIVDEKKKKTVTTLGISPYFLTQPAIEQLLKKDLLPKIKNDTIAEIYYYGTGLANAGNAKIIKNVLRSLFPSATIELNHDLTAAARAVCGNEKGIVSILGTGSGICYYNGKKIAKERTGIGYVLGDEGSGAYLGKKIIQYYLYDTFDDDLRARFDAQFQTTPVEILENVYKKPLPNRYLAGFAGFLAENRGHYMIENIIEDGLNDFIISQVYKFRESWRYPLHFVGGIAYGFKDVLKKLCSEYELEVGKIIRYPMEGLIDYHK